MLLKNGALSSCASGNATQDWIPAIGEPLTRNSGAESSECAMPAPAFNPVHTSPGLIACAEPSVSR
ncbi:MAG: hypothetical protein R3C16_06795 [Hyphomonadaceae bacterium]